MLIAEFEQPIKSQQVLNFVRTINARTLIGCNPARKSKIEINLKIISVSNGYRDLTSGYPIQAFLALCLKLKNKKLQLTS